MAANNQSGVPNPFTTPAGGGSITKIDPITIPGFGPTADKEFEAEKYSVKYVKIDMDNPSAITLLEQLETDALRNNGIYILNKDKFTFMDRYFLIVSYLEEAITTRSVPLKT